MVGIFKFLVNNYIDEVIGGDMNLGRESETLEFKESTAEFEKACKAIVAMLNKSGEGKIYFGVKDNGEVIGQVVGNDTLSILTDRIKNSIKPAIYPIVKKIQYDKKDIISVSFKGTNKPYAYKGAFYMRVEQQNLLMDPLVLRELIKESYEFNDKWENEITEFGEGCIDEEAVEKFYRQSVAMGRINKYDHTSSELLTQLNLMVDGKLTNAGYYLFSNNKPLVYKAVEYPTKDRLDPIDLKRFEGNIFNLIDAIIQYSYQKIDWRTEIVDIQRKEIPEIPVVALREIIINSLVHCDYISETQHQITVDPERLEIYSPGVFKEYSPIDYVEQFLPSMTKHKVIQGIIFKAFDIETLGRGIKRMDACCKKANVKWDYKKYPYGFTFIFLRANNRIVLSKEATKILDYMENNNGILESNAKACMVINQKERTSRNAIGELIKNRKIERIGSKKVGYWKIIDFK